MHANHGKPFGRLGRWKDRDCVPRLAAPKADRVIATARGQQAPVLGESGGTNSPGVSFECSTQFAALCVENINSSIFNPESQQSAMAIKYQVMDRVIVPLEIGQRLATLRIPKINCSVLRPAG